MAGIDDDVVGDLELTETDKVSATWRRIETHLQRKQALLRRKNDNDMDEKQTTRIRAQLALIKELLAAGASRD